MNHVVKTAYPIFIDFVILRILVRIAAFVCPWMGLLAVAAEKPPNVLFIAVDDLRPDLGCYGHPVAKTPSIDAFAATARVFQRAYCQQAVCNPSRTSVMTGLRPDTTGVTSNHAHFRTSMPTAVTLPQHFKRNGYFSQSIGKIFHGVFPDGASKTTWDTMGDPFSWSVPTTRFGPRYYYTEEGVEQAKQSYLSMYGPAAAASLAADKEAWTKKLVFGPMTEAPDVSDATLYDGKVAAKAVETLRELSGGSDPFFLAVGFIKPHSPFVAPKRYWDLYDESEISLASQTTLPEEAPALSGHGSGEIRRYTDQPSRGSIAASDQRKMRHGYLACVSFIDAQVGKVLHELKRLKLDRETIVVLFGDHGYHLGEQGLWGKTTNFELDTRVPLIIRSPQQPRPGASTDSIVELVDLFPTLVDLAGLDSPQQLAGVSLQALLSDPEIERRSVALSQYPRGKSMGYSMRSEGYRYTEWIERGTERAIATELYHYDDRDSHHFDPVERINLAADPSQQTRLAEMSTQLHRHLERDRPTVATSPAGNASQKRAVFRKNPTHGFRIPALATSKQGTLLAFAERRMGLRDHAQNDIVLRRSFDGGKTWEPLQVLRDEGGDSLNDPCAVVLDNGRILLRYTRFPQGVHARNSSHTVIADPGYGKAKNVRVYLMHSDDDGESWSEPEDVTRSFRRETAVSIGSPGVGIQKQRPPNQGRILFPLYEVDHLGDGNRMSGNSVCFSDDGGHTWTLTPRVPEGETKGGGNEAQLVELADGSILLTSRVFGANASARKMSRSNDGGENWAPFTIASEMITPPCMSSVLTLGADAAGSETLVHVVPNDTTRRQSGRLFLSHDQGGSWQPSLLLEAGPFAYASLGHINHNSIGCLYEADGYQSIQFQSVDRTDLVPVTPAATETIALASTSFEQLQSGPFTRMKTEVGNWVADSGNAEIDSMHSRTGKQSLHLVGGSDRHVDLEIGSMPPAAGLVFHAERWTRRSPFRFRVEAITQPGESKQSSPGADSDRSWKEIYEGDETVRIGKFSTKVVIPLPPGTSRLRFRCTSPARSGLLVDDVALVDAKTLAIERVGEEKASSNPQLDRQTFRFGRPFSDHMVLQANASLPVWGTAKPQSPVLVRLGREQIETTADEAGRWRVQFPPRESSSDPVSLVAVAAEKQLVVHDVLVGQVWLCGGQSNMEWPLHQSAEGQATLKDLDEPLIRLLRVRGAVRGSSGQYTQAQLDRLSPKRFAEGKWEVANSENAADFSAVAWYFGHAIQNRTREPVGLICPAVGGTPTEAWISREALASDPQLKGLVVGNWLDNELLGDFCRERGRLNLQTAVRERLSIPSDDLGPNHPFKPGFMWEASVQPLVPYAIAGVIWYQGESNAENPMRVGQHSRLFPLLVSRWREAWSRNDLPFAFVQLPALDRPAWPLFRDSQRRMLNEIDHVGMAITIDTGSKTNVHPRAKRAVGERLEEVAFELTRPRYSEPPHPASGPLLREVRRDGRELVLTFRLRKGQLISSDGQAIRHFEVASDDGDFVPAVAKISGPREVRVQSSKVNQPAHVRYAWKSFPEPPVNLANDSDDPASPFSTRPQPPRPNILLIVGEDHGCELSCYGDPVIQTPNLDRLANEGILFENGYVTQSVCSPSRSTIFTGLYPHQNGQLGLATHQFRWFKKWPTTYSLLKRAGYRTGLIGKTHVLPEEAVESFVDFRFQKSSNFSKKQVSEYAEQAGEFFTASEEPFFITVNYPDAHWPLQGQVDGFPKIQVDPESVRVMPYVGTENARLREVARRYYDCMLRLDACVGQLLWQLDQSGKADNTLVIFIGDHGAQMARGKVTVYEGGMRIPYIARWPGVIAAGQRSDSLVSTIDLLPTFMDVARTESPEGLPGESLRPIFPGNENSKVLRRYLVCERNCDAAHLTFPQRTVRDERFKLIHTLVLDREDPAARYYRIHGASHWAGSLTDDELQYADERTIEGYERWLNPAEYQLYDLSVDPHEWNDLSNDPRYAEDKNRLTQALRDWQVATNDPLRDPELVKQLMEETDQVNRDKRRSPDSGWRYLEYLCPDPLVTEIDAK